MDADPPKSAIECSEPQSFERSTFVREMKEEREEILRFKWLESEKAHQDIGIEKALLLWIMRHRSKWLERRREMKMSGQFP
jgi:hypothetical protein